MEGLPLRTRRTSTKSPLRNTSSMPVSRSCLAYTIRATAFLRRHLENYRRMERLCGKMVTSRLLWMPVPPRSGHWMHRSLLRLVMRRGRRSLIWRRFGPSWSRGAGCLAWYAILALRCPDTDPSLRAAARQMFRNSRKEPVVHPAAYQW